MNKAARTKEFIIQKAAPLLNTKGYAATSLSDIITATGLTKGSIYGNFTSKDELVLQAYSHNVERFRRCMDEAIDQGRTPYDKLLYFVEFYRNNWDMMVHNGGCAMLNAATEADDNIHYLQEPVKRNFVQWQKRLASIMESGATQGVFRDLDASTYAYTLIMLIEGGILLSLSLKDRRHLDTALDRVITIIKQEVLN